MTIKALIMAGGKGSRLGHYTAVTPKPLIKIGNQALIDYVINYLNEAKIKDIFVSVNNEKNKLKEYLKNKNVSIIETKGSIAYAILQSANIINAPFVCVPSDVIQQANTIIETHLHFKNINCSALHHYSEKSYKAQQILSYTEFKETIKQNKDLFRTASIYDNKPFLDLQDIINKDTDGATTLISDCLSNNGHVVKYLLTNKKFFSINTPIELEKAQTKAPNFFE
ncbi:MAG: sugar phosphate nucleotidyltransferase [Candidatus Diapherotrites archaeon]|nr:sugar phosphate nucleotidyltransferase [Candidatus Diapherotrites archaeon]